MAQSNIANTITEYGRRLFGFIRRRVASDEDAEDILQDVWQQLSSQPELQAIDQISGWLHEVARNKIIDRSRKHREALLDDLGPDDADGESLGLEQFLVASGGPESDHMNRVFWDELADALEDLPMEQREVFVENELEGRTLREIAETSGVNIKTLISRKNYAVRALRHRLERLYHEFMEY